MEEQQQQQQYAPGDVVETTYGAGVITQCPTDSSAGSSGSSSGSGSSAEEPQRTFYRVLLWRVPGKSIGSSSEARLQPNAVRRIIIIIICLYFE